MKTRVLVNGAKGKMGSLLCHTINQSEGFELSGTSNSTQELNELLNQILDLLLEPPD